MAKTITSKDFERKINNIRSTLALELGILTVSAYMSGAAAAESAELTESQEATASNENEPQKDCSKQDNKRRPLLQKRQGRD